MKYLLLIYSDDSDYEKMSEADMGELMQAYGKFQGEIEASGQLKGSNRLQPASDATTVRIRNVKTLTTDGPFAETKEQLGGYYLIEANDLDEATAWAAKIPTATTGSIEVRPIWE